MRFCALALAILLALAAARSTGARPAKGDGPTALAAGFGAVWVGTGRGELLRVDARTGLVRKRVRKEPGQIGHVASVVAAYGAVWLSDSGLGVARIDPRHASPPTSAFPSHGQLAAGARSIWAADPWRDRVLRIDPGRARVVASMRVPGRLVGLYGAPAAAYVVYAPTSRPLTGPGGVRLLQRLDPSSARLVGRPVSFDCAVAVGAGRRAIWTVDSCNRRLARRDPRTLEVQIERPSPPTAAISTFAFGSFWSFGWRVVRYDAMTLRVQARVPVPGAIVAAGEGAVWILETRSRTAFLRKLDPRTNRIVRTFEVSG